MKVLYLFNKIKTGRNEEENIAVGKGHDSHLFGMLRLRKHGIETGYIEIEQFFPKKFCQFIRKHMLNIFWVHILLFPKFFSYDLVFTSTAYGSLLLWAMFKALGMKKLKWVMLDFNILGTIGERKTLRQKLFAWAIAKADGIVTISSAERDALENLFPHMKGRIIFLHEATDTQFFKLMPEIPEEDFILSVGLDPSRDFKTLIDATIGLNVQVKLAAKVEALKPYEPLPAHVSVHQFSHDEMLRQYAKAKIAVVGLKPKDGKHHDSMGTLSLTEAMAMGKAVVATHTTSMESYITDGVNGIFVPKMDVRAMREALQKLLADDVKRHALGVAAREFAVKYCDAELFGKQLADFLKNVHSR